MQAPQQVVAAEFSEEMKEDFKNMIKEEIRSQTLRDIDDKNKK